MVGTLLGTGSPIPDTEVLNTCRSAASPLVLHSPEYKIHYIVLKFVNFQVHLQKLLEKKIQELILVMLLSVSQVS